MFEYRIIVMALLTVACRMIVIVEMLDLKSISRINLFLNKYFYKYQKALINNYI